MATPFGNVTMPADKKSSIWPVVGYVLLGVGGLGAVLAFAMKPADATPTGAPA